MVNFSKLNFLFDCGLVDNAPVDPALISRNKRLIQFYVVLYCLLWASAEDLSSWTGNYLLVLFLISSAGYYILVTRSVKWLRMRLPVKNLNNYAFTTGFLFSSYIFERFIPIVDSDVIDFWSPFLRWCLYLLLLGVVYLSLSV